MTWDHWSDVPAPRSALCRTLPDSSKTKKIRYVFNTCLRGAVCLCTPGSHKPSGRWQPPPPQKKRDSESGFIQHKR